MLTEKQISLIEATILPYWKGERPYAFNGAKGCQYLTEEGNKCAFGLHLKEEYLTDNIEGSSASDVLSYWVESPLKDEAREANLSPDQWDAIQVLHDTAAVKKGDTVLRSLLYKLDPHRQLTKLHSFLRTSKL